MSKSSPTIPLFYYKEDPGVFTTGFSMKFNTAVKTRIAGLSNSDYEKVYS
jgi:hypothetical protein